MFYVGSLYSTINDTFIIHFFSYHAHYKKELSVKFFHYDAVEAHYKVKFDNVISVSYNIIVGGTG